INSVYSGVIRSLIVQPGYTVKKGQVIATIANPDFIQAQSQYLNVISKITLAEIEVKRQKELNAGNAGIFRGNQFEFRASVGPREDRKCVRFVEGDEG
ncbi:MAG: biotin/lipoyl-binding protein, partial [Cytophagaceae bacterium]